MDKSRKGRHAQVDPIEARERQDFFKQHKKHHDKQVYRALRAEEDEIYKFVPMALNGDIDE